MQRYNSILDATTSKNNGSGVDLETSCHSANDIIKIEQLLEKYSSSIETFQRDILIIVYVLNNRLNLKHF